MTKVAKTNRISIRLTPHQQLILDELKDALNSSYSVLIRTIIGDFLQKNEDTLYEIIDKHRSENANDKQITKEGEKDSPQ